MAKRSRRDYLRGERTGLTVVAVPHGHETLSIQRADQTLPAGGQLFMVGATEGLESFPESFLEG